MAAHELQGVVDVRIPVRIEGRREQELPVVVEQHEQGIVNADLQFGGEGGRV